MGLDNPGLPDSGIPGSKFEAGRAAPTDEIFACSFNFQKLGKDQYATDKELILNTILSSKKICNYVVKSSSKQQSTVKILKKEQSNIL